MKMFLKGAASAAVLAIVTHTTSVAADAQGYRRDHQNYRRSQPVIGLQFGNIAFGYRDGYWDNGHRWHNWRNRSDYNSYRGRHRSEYRDWNHDRDSDHGWRR